MDRGVIASPGIINPMPGGFEMERPISGEELRYYVMYWDQVVIPGNNLVYIGIPEEEEFIACGAIERPRIQFQGTFGGDMMTSAILSCQGIVAEGLVNKKDSDWVIHQIGNERIFNENFNHRNNIIRLELTDLLPVPSNDTPVHEILEFKDRRSDELGSLHNSLDKLYLEILNSPDSDLTLKKNISYLQSSISDLNKSFFEKFRISKNFDLSVSINISEILNRGVWGAVLDFYSNGLTMPIATLGNAASGLINIQPLTTFTFGPASSNLKLDYLARANKEGLLEK